MTTGRGLDERGFIAANANRSHIVYRCRNRAVLGVVVIVVVALEFGLAPTEKFSGKCRSIESCISLVLMLWGIVIESLRCGYGVGLVVLAVDVSRRGLYMGILSPG